MSTVNDVMVYPGAFVLDVWTEIVCTDQDADGDLTDYTPDFEYDPGNGATPIQWPTGTVVQVWGVDANKNPVVKALIIPVVPILPPLGCLGRFLPRFPKGRPHPDAPIGSGSLSGTLNPPPPTPAASGGGTARTPKKFTIPNVAIFVDILV